MTPSELSRMLANDAERVARNLLPNGKKASGEWKAGNVEGDAGQSLSVELSGEHAGRWKDFATGEGGDLIDLFMAVNSVSLADAIQQAKQYLGVKDDRDRVRTTKPKQSFKRPERPASVIKPKPTSPVREYLHGRGLTDATLDAYRVAEDGRFIVFPFLRDNELVFLKWLGLDRDNGKKKIRASADSEPCLFGWQAVPPDARTITIVEGECFPGSAEIMTPSGWVALSDYQAGKVAQYRNGQIEFVNPLARIQKPFSGHLVRYESRGYVSETTPGHRLVSIDHKGNTYKHTASEGPRNAQNLIPRVGVLNGVGLGLSKAQIAVCLAVSADASIDVRKQSYAGGAARNLAPSDRYARFGFKKDRKVDRLRSALRESGIEFSDKPIANGYRSICFSIPGWVPGRELPWSWIEHASQEEREFIIAELEQWDGNGVTGRNQSEFSSKLKRNADWVQALAHTTGRVSTIMHRRNDFGEWYKVSILHGKQTTSWQRLKGNDEAVPHNGDVFCVQVPSGMLMVRQEGKVTITGNCDAMSATQSGYPALSVPFGGGAGEKQRWIEYEYDRLQRFDVIYLAMDNDEAGNEGTQEIIKRLGRERCMIVRLPSKDWNECLMASIPGDVLADCYANAESLDPDKLVGIDAFAEGLHHLLDNPMETGGLGLPWDKAEHLIRLRGSETTLWTGWNGHGKSQLLGFIAVSSLIKERVPFCIASMEMKPTISLLRMVRQAAGIGTPSHAFADAILDAMRGNLWIYDQLDSADIIEMLSAFKYAAKRYGVKHFIVDSLAKLGIGEEDYDGQKKAINALTNFAHEVDVHVHLVAHPRKGMDEDRPPNKMDVRGGASLTDMADNVITVWRNKPKEREAEKMEKEPGMETKHQDEGDVRLIVSKQRGGTAWEGTIALWFDRASFQYMGRESHKPHPMVAYSNRQEVAA